MCAQQINKIQMLPILEIDAQSFCNKIEKSIKATYDSVMLAFDVYQTVTDNIDRPSFEPYADAYLEKVAQETLWYITMCDCLTGNFHGSMPNFIERRKNKT